MLRPRWRKMLRDLGHHKTRTAIVVLSIAVGVFAVGMILSTQLMLSEDMAASYLASYPASASLYPDSFDDELVETVRHVEGVREAEGRVDGAGLRMRVGPDEWRDLRVDVIGDYDDIRLNQITPVSGAWPPPMKGILMERNSLAFTNAGVGDEIEVETREGKLRRLRIAGLVHDMNNPPAEFVGVAFGYVSFDTLEWLGEERAYNELNILVAEQADDKAHIQAVADRVEDKIEKTGRVVYWTWIPEPGEHPANEQVQPMLIILGVLGALSLLLSGFLVINTINALMAQQVRQIGIMKVVGARAGQLVGMYLSLVLVFGLLALLIAVPLGALAAYAMTQYLAHLINFDLTGFRLPPQALALEVGVGLLVPLLAALYPVLSGARISVYAAITSYGLGRGRFGRGWLDRLLLGRRAPYPLPDPPPDKGRAVGGQRSFVFRRPSFVLSRPMRISLRNTFRRKGRLALTLSTLTLGGAIFVAVLTVHASLLKTLDEALTYWNYEIEVSFAHAHRIAEIEREALRVPGVAAAESWNGNTARRQRPDGHEGPNLYILGVPADTTMIQPVLLAGRWLRADDTNALVVNTEVLKEETDIRVGDEVVLKMEGREETWRVVGVVQGILTGRIAYANQPYFAHAVRYVGRAGGVQVAAAPPGDTSTQDAAFQLELGNRLKEHFEARGMRVRAASTTAALRENIEYQFNIIVVFLAIMAVLIALVGGLGLMGTMSINVLERTREIGVMRAVGASDVAVLKIFVIEGLFIGLLSWLAGALLALPISKLLSDVVGVAFLDAPLIYTFSLRGALLWLGLVLLLAGLASLLPAWNAARLTVREVLAYE
jgi:putative ABC transport system permease protein